MLQKFKNTSYTFIFFLVFAFSFIALQVTTEEVEAAPGVCEPVERIRNMKDTARHSDYKVWEERCQVSGSNGQCGNRTEWPAGDGGRCETTADDTVAAQDNIGVCEPIERIRNMKDTARHSDYKVWEERCQVSGSNGQCGNRTEWPAGDGGRCETTTADTVAAQDVDHEAVPENGAAQDVDTTNFVPENGAAQNNTGEVCHPNDRITGMYNTMRHKDWEYGQELCAREGVNADVCATTWGGRCQWGVPPMLEPVKQINDDEGKCATLKAKYESLVESCCVEIRSCHQMFDWGHKHCKEKHRTERQAFLDADSGHYSQHGECKQ